MGIAERWLIKSANWTKNLKKTTWFQLHNSTVCVDESFIDYTQAPIKSRFHRNSITQGPLGICNNCRELMWFYLVWICHLCYVQTKNSITYHRSLTCCLDLVLKSVLSDSITRGQRKTAVYPPNPPTMSLLWILVNYMLGLSEPANVSSRCLWTHCNRSDLNI